MIPFTKYKFLLFPLQIRRTPFTKYKGFLYMYKVTYEGRDFRDDCKELLLSLSLYFWFPATT